MDLAEDNLFLHLEKLVRSRRYRDIIAEMCTKIHQVLKPTSDKVTIFVDLLSIDLPFVDRMMEILMAYRFENFNENAPHTTFISLNEYLDRSPIVLLFQRLIGGYNLKGGIFADMLVHALENALQKTLQNPM